jgi:glutamate racemase
MTQIIIFDTGTGGKIFANHFRQEIPNVKITEVIDSTNAPYGDKTPTQILTLTEQALRPYLQGLSLQNNPRENLIVLACNTATAYALSYLRAKYPDQTFIGTEPALKPAIKLSQNGKILVLATPATLNSPRYQNLKSKYTTKIKIYEPNCANWAKQIDHHALTPKDISATLSPYQSYLPDTIILACTHYLAIPTQTFTDIFPNAKIYSPLPAVTNRVKALLPPP